MANHRRNHHLMHLTAIAVAVIALADQSLAAEDAVSPSSAPAESVILTGRTMGTTYRIKYWGDGTATPADVREKVDALLKRFDKQMSTYREDSELSRFNRSVADEWFPVSPETAYVVERAIEYQQSTGGTMDVTVGPVLRLWHFGAGLRRKRIMRRRQAPNSCTRR